LRHHTSTMRRGTTTIRIRGHAHSPAPSSTQACPPISRASTPCPRIAGRALGIGLRLKLASQEDEGVPEPLWMGTRERCGSPGWEGELHLSPGGRGGGSGEFASPGILTRHSPYEGPDSLGVLLFDPGPGPEPLPQPALLFDSRAMECPEACFTGPACGGLGIGNPNALRDGEAR
jgi:hypothetical protein